MADVSTLVAQRRTQFGKGAARRTRRANLIPAVLYEGGNSPQHIALPEHQTFLALKDNLNALLTIDIDGSSEMALAKDIQRDPVRRSIEHLDLIVVRRGAKVTVEVPVVIVGESAPETIHQVELQQLTVTVPATEIPETIEIDIEGLESGSVVRVGDVPRPADAVLDDDEDYEVVRIFEPQITEEDLEPEAADEEEAQAEVAEEAAGEAAAGENE